MADRHEGVMEGAPPAKRLMTGDKWIWLSVLFLSALSLLEVYSVSDVVAYARETPTPPSYFLFQQLKMILLAITTMGITMLIPVRFWSRFRFLFWAGLVLLLIFTDLYGPMRNGARRWFQILGFQFQTSELAKVVLIIWLASWFKERQASVQKFWGNAFPVSLSVAIPCALVMVYDLGTAILLGMVCLGMFAIGNMPWRYIFLLLGIVVAAGGWYLFGPMPASLQEYSPRVMTHRMRAYDYVRRISGSQEGTVLTPDEQLRQRRADEQSKQALIAVASGGFLGKNIGNGTQRVMLPEPHCDFIFALIVEELGFWSWFVLFAYLLILWRIFEALRACRSPYKGYLISGAGLLIGFQAFMHVGISVGLLPVTGITLPFVSYGGTSLLVTGFLLGLVQSVVREDMEKRLKDEPAIA